MIILGLNAYHGDASAALLVDGDLVAAVEEERFTRIKHAAGFPVHAVRYCLAAAGARLADVDRVAVARDPRARWAHKVLHAVRLPRFALERSRVAARFASIPRALAAATDTDPSLVRAALHRIEHHRAHLASAFFASDASHAAVLSLDGMGDFGSGAWGVGRGERLSIAHSVAFPHSIGMFYTALTQYLGFWGYGDEYKVMGLAALGTPAYLAQLRQVVHADARRGYRLDLRYFTHHRRGVSMTWLNDAPVIGRLFSAALETLLGPARQTGEPINERFTNIAASLQAHTEDLVLDVARRLHAATGCATLAYAGGVAFNCVANARLLEATPFESLTVPPAAGDAGLALGAALATWHEDLGAPRRFTMRHAYWGPEFTEAAIAQVLAARGVSHVRWDPDGLCREVARLLDGGHVVGWFQGRAEWGPRALGARSLLADPRRADMRDRLNDQVKRREPFRPFAPSIMAERAAEWFEDAHPSPFMSLALRVRAERRHLVPAVTHVDGTARLQTVSHSDNPLYWQLLHAFDALTGVPMVLNTSFNEHEPIVTTPDEAIDCFQRTSIDALAIGPFLARRRPAP